MISVQVSHIVPHLNYFVKTGLINSLESLHIWMFSIIIYYKKIKCKVQVSKYKVQEAAVLKARTHPPDCFPEGEWGVK